MPPLGTARPLIKFLRLPGAGREAPLLGCPGARQLKRDARVAEAVPGLLLGRAEQSGDREVAGGDRGGFRDSVVGGHIPDVGTRVGADPFRRDAMLLSDFGNSVVGELLRDVIRRADLYDPRKGQAGQLAARQAAIDVGPVTAMPAQGQQQTARRQIGVLRLTMAARWSSAIWWRISSIT